MNSDISISHFEKCECSGHMLEVERYVWKWKEGEEDGFNFACWEMGHRGGSMRWKERIRWCWHLLTKGTLWADSIMITNEGARRVSEFIQQHIPNERPNDKANKEIPREEIQPHRNFCDCDGLDAQPSHYCSGSI
jgi:hypothetical protein